jgi:UDP-GlcNAc3NAcA epimerase
VKIVSIIGARPQFIKAAPVSLAIEMHNQKGTGPRIQEILVHTGQHYDHDMSQIFFDELEIRKPEYNLGIGSGKHGEMTGAMLKRIEEVLLEEIPDRILVYGDTNSTLAGALAASKLHIPVAHVEAGLRSFNRLMPEEINRVLTDHISDLLFCPTDTAVENLSNEGVREGVYKVGDVMLDAFLSFKSLAEKKSSVLSNLGLTPGEYCLATIHRQENTDNPERLSSIINAFNELAGPDCPFILPLHPRTRKALKEYGIPINENPHLRPITPVGYLDIISLESHARVILTDSGGVQKEAFFAGVPCVTLRDETEWVETVEAGWNNLAGSVQRSIGGTFEKAIRSVPEIHPSLYGTGKASELMIKLISH